MKNAVQSVLQLKDDMHRVLHNKRQNSNEASDRGQKEIK